MGTPIGSPVPALTVPLAPREDYNGNAFNVSSDLSSVVYARPNAATTSTSYRKK